MATVNEKMTALANEIRELSGTTEAIGLDAMATHVGEANNEVDSQVELLAQAVAALEGKASGSGGSGEDVTAETDEYTTKLESLGTAIAELESELEGKASDGVALAKIQCVINSVMGNEANFIMCVNVCEDGIIKPEIRVINIDDEIILIENVVLGSVITIVKENAGEAISNIAVFNWALDHELINGAVTMLSDSLVAAIHVVVETQAIEIID